MIDKTGRLDQTRTRQLDDLGPQVFGGGITAVIRVSPDGDGTDGQTWGTAYQNIPEALDAASVDTDDLTLILIGTHATFYDINLTGDPTWAANVILCGSVPDFTDIRNTHGTATSILRLTGKSGLIALNFTLTDSVNGVIMTGEGPLVERVIFNGTALTGAATALHLDGAGNHHARVTGGTFHGHVTHMTGLLIDQYSSSHFEGCEYHDCLTAIQIIGADSDENDFSDVDIGNCTLGIDIDAGNNQHFHVIRFHGNTRNIDDEIGDHDWTELIGAFDIAILPDNLVGINVATGGAGAYGADTELLSAAGRDNPFRIVGHVLDPDAAPLEWYQVRFSDDSGSSFFEIVQFISDRKEGAAAPSGTEHIFNKGTRISASARDATGGDNVAIWLSIQEV